MKQLYIVLILFFVSYLDAQKVEKVLKLPEKFENPVSYEGQSKIDFETLKSDKGDRVWYVTSDRENNPTFLDRDEYSDVKHKLKFGEGFYVIAEKGEWIKLGKPANPNDFVDDRFRINVFDYGWIKKSKMLLWYNSMVHPETRIHLKGFLLNKASDFERNKLKQVYYYHDPDIKVKDNKGKLDLYNFYFIYKIEEHEGRDNNRYLLGTGSVHNPMTSPGNLKGWVDQRRIDRWNTRIALAPNFEQSAYNERKSNPNLRVRGYSQYRDCKKVATIDNQYYENVLWDNDPTICHPDLLGKTDHKRFKKDIIRFPIISYEPNSFYYRSGVIATHGGGNVNLESQRRSITSGISKKTENTNVFFLIDGSSKKVGEYKQEITSLIDLVQEKYKGKNCKIGAAIYKDSKERNKADIFKYVELSNSPEKAKNLINTNYFGSVGEYDNYNCVGYAMEQTFLKANFNEIDNNILIHIGDQPDISRNADRRSELAEYGAKRNVLRSYFKEFSLHWLVMDVNDNDDLESDQFQEYIRGKLMNDFMKKIYQEANSIAKSITSKSIAEPILPELNEGEILATTDFYSVLAFLKPKQFKALEPNAMSTFVSEYLNIVDSKTEKQAEVAESFVKEGLSVDPASGNFTAEVIPILLKSLGKESGKILTPAEQKALLTEIEGEKFYSEIFLPTQIKDAGFNPYSYVLFMPREDLIRYNSTMRNIKRTMMGTEDQNRQALEDLMTELAEQLSGESNTSKLGNYTIDDISDLLQGIAKEGYNVERNYNVKIKDIRNRKLFHSEKLREFNMTISKKYEILANILKNQDYEFQYVNDNTYYWIPMTNVF